MEILTQLRKIYSLVRLFVLDEHKWSYHNQGRKKGRLLPRPRVEQLGVASGRLGERAAQKCRRQFRGNVGSNGFEKLLIGTQGSETPERASGEEQCDERRKTTMLVAKHSLRPVCPVPLAVRGTLDTPPAAAYF